MSIQSVRQQLAIEGGKFEGDLFIEIIPEGAGTARMIGPINGSQLAYNPGEADVLERTSTMRGTFGQNLNTDSQPGSPSIEIGFNDLGREQLELQMRGSSEDIDEPGGAFTEEVVTVTAKGSWLELPLRNINPTGFTVTDGGATTYVFDAEGGADYGPIDWKQGFMFIPEDSTIAPGTININGTNWGVGGYRIKANQLSQIRGKFILLARNRADPNLRDWRFTVLRANVNPSQAADFLSNEFTSAVLSGPAETPEGASSPFEIERLSLATS